jgi:transposase
MVPAMSGGPTKLTIPPEIAAEMTPAVWAFVELLLKRIETLEAEVAELKQRLNRSPQNSSLPPSSQHPHAKPAPPRKPSGKKPGGQPGHLKSERALIATEQCSEVVTLKPSACRRYGRKLAGTDAQSLQHQVWELPEIRPRVTEYQRHRLVCDSCSETTCAELPPGVPTGQAGPQLIALVALLMGCFRQSKRRVSLFLEQVLGQPCSPGWVVKLQNHATAALRPPYVELAGQLPTEEALAIDESSTKEGRVKAWLWTCVAATFTVFTLRTTRAATVLQELLGKQFNGAVTVHEPRAI